MLEGQNKKLKLMVASGLALATLALLGASLIAREQSWFTKSPAQEQDLNNAQLREQAAKSEVLPLVGLYPEERAALLLEIALGKPSVDRNRARYILATDLIAQKDGVKALRWLNGLEKDYRLLAPQIAFKQAQAYEIKGDTEQASKIYQRILKEYPQSPVAGEVLYVLGKSQREYWQQAITEFPHYPRTHEIVRQLLEDGVIEAEARLPLWLLLARYDVDAQDIDQIRDKLFHEYASQLKPQDWEMLAKGYWQQFEYGKAGDAYANSPKNAENAYLAARGRHLQGRRKEAKQAYEKLIEEFPQAEITGLGLRRLASLSSGEDGLVYLEQVITKFPQDAAEAILTKARILDKMGRTREAAQARQKVLDEYSTSEAAAKYRWQIAQQKADDGSILEALQWANPIVNNNSESETAAKAGFWVGKWAQKLGRQEDAQTAFEEVLRNHPHSYYAWRSAAMLGLPVGNFQSVRQMNPEIAKSDVRPVPPAGSKTFKELFLLGQDDDAWTLFHAEIENQPEISVAEQFTQGLLKLAKGQNLQGIGLVWSLKKREQAHEVSDWQNLRRTSQYWQALFPIPYDRTILDWSRQRGINPLLVTSLIRQESRFEREIRSSAGAVGLMQVMPGTGDWVAKKINLVDYSLTNPDDNVNLGTWYLGHTHEQYGNNSLLAVASYNAGPGNVAKWVKEYGFSDPDVFVEHIPFRETKGYVESVFSNYWNYLRLYDPEIGSLIPIKN